MLSKIIEFSVRNKLIVGLFTAALVLFGAYEVTKLPIDAVPDITNNQVQIITVAPSLGATDIERLVTFPIEQANSNINGIEEIRSFSRFGLSVVTVVFDEKIDVYWARQQVSERLQHVQNEIPPGVGTPELGPISSGLGEIYQYVVRPKAGYEKAYDITELRTIQDWIIRRQLLGVKGVAEVSSFGGKLKQFEVAVNMHKLQSYRLSLADLYAALEKNNQNTGGAYIEKGPTVLYIRSEGLIAQAEDVEHIAVKTTSDGIPIYLRDVAEVKIGYATRYGALTYNDEGEAAGAIVMMLKGANSSEVIKNVKARITEIQKTLPEGVVIEPFLDRTKMVNNAIKTIETNLAEGALIVIFVLVLFLGNMRAGLLVASVIPLAMLFAIIMMNLFGVSGNLMSLGALDFGLIVDGAVIIVEAVLHQLHFGKTYAHVGAISQTDMDRQVGRSASKMVNSAVFGQIIILIVYLPIFTLQGIEGKMFIPMAQTVTFALLGAFILSLTYIPMMSALVLSKKISHKANWSERMMARLEKVYQASLKKALRYPKTIVSVVLLMFLGALFVLSRMGGEFIPALEEGDFAVETRVLTGSNLNTSIEYVTKTAHVLRSQFPEVEKVVTKIGSGEVPTDPMPIEAADMMVILKDKKEWTSAKSFPELADKMANALADVPGVSTGFQYPVQMRFNELMTGAKQDVVCKIFGENLDSLVNYADKLGKIVQTVSGAEDLYIETVSGMPQVLIRYHRGNIAQYGLAIDDINSVVNMAFAGKKAGLIYEGEKRFDLVLRLEESQRHQLSDVRNLLVPTPRGLQVPLYQLADVDVVNGPAQIQREDAKRRIVVGFNVRGRDVKSIVQELQAKVEQQIPLSTGYYVTYGGAFENLEKATGRLLVAVPVALALIFILLYFAFRSLKESLLIYTAIPLSAIGGIYLLALRGLPFSISAGIGFIALFGVAVLNGIVLIAEYNRLRADGENNLLKVVLKGTKTRLRPVLMTAFVASLGFLPMAISQGAGAEVQRPLATVVIGGLLVATFLTLFVLPILFILFENFSFKKMKINKKIVSIVLLIGLSFEAYPQKVSLNEALAIAEKENLSIKKDNLLMQYYAKRKTAGTDLPLTTLSTEIGQINGPTLDNKIGISQSFVLGSFAKQKQIYQQEWQLAQSNQNLDRLELKRNLSELFYRILVLSKQEQLWTVTEAQYLHLREKTRLSLEKGLINIVESSAVELQYGALQNKLKVLRANINEQKSLFQVLMNSTIAYEPEAASLLYPSKQLQENSNHDILHPSVIMAQHTLDLAKANLKLEKGKLLPELSLGYSNQSFRDIDNKRYHVFEVGIGLPVFFGVKKKILKAEQYKIAIAENELDQQKQRLAMELKQLKTRWTAQHAVVENYQTLQLPKAEQIAKAAESQYLKGEINYLEWVQLANQVLQVQEQYFEALDELNQTSIALDYLLSK